MTIESLLADYPVRRETPVAWGQMDAFAHVNNTVYFRWFEDARIMLFERVGWLEAMEQTRVGPILARTQCVFKRPLTYPDTVHIGARVQDLAADRFTMSYRIASHEQQAIVAEGDARIISYDYSANAKAPIPDGVRAALAAL